MKKKPRRRQTSRNRSKRTGWLVGLIAILLALFITWPYLRKATLAAFVPVGRGQPGCLEDRVTGDALFFGGFSFLVAPADGRVEFLVEEGESVRAGQVLAKIKNPETAGIFEDSLAYATGQLALYDEQTGEQFSSLVQAVQLSYEENLQAFLDLKRVGAGDFAGKLQRENRFLNTSEKLRSVREDLAKIEGERARLASVVSSIQLAASESTVHILAPVAGQFTRKWSSAHETCLGVSPKTLDASDLAVLVRECKEPRELSVKDGQNVSRGDFLGRVVSGQDLSFYLPVKTDLTPGLSEGQQLEMTYPGGRLNVTVEGVSHGKPPGFSVITGTVARSSFVSLDKAQEVSLTTRKKSGTVIPVSSLLEVEGRTGVLVLRKTYARFVPCEVLMIKDKKAVVQGISESDDIVLRGWKLLEGKRVR